jgi:hypothetical protein
MAGGVITDAKDTLINCKPAVSMQMNGQVQKLGKN